jgi:hypothetical protein
MLQENTYRGGKTVEVCQRLDILTESLNDRYLASPAMIGADKTTCVFWHLVDKIQNITLGWKEKTLSMGGNETFLKAIAQAILVTVCQVPKSICKEMKVAIAKYWWGDELMILTIRRSTGNHGENYGFFP